MFTDVPPRNRAEFLESDRIETLDLPLNANLQEISQRLESAMKAEMIRDVRSACTTFLASACKFLCSPDLWRPGTSRKTSTHPRPWDIRTLWRLRPDSMLIRVWMRTAVRKEVTS